MPEQKNLVRIRGGSDRDFVSVAGEPRGATNIEALGRGDWAGHYRLCVSLTVRKDISLKMWFPSFSPYALGRRFLGQTEKNQVPDAKDRLLWAPELLDLAEYLIGILETGDRGVVVQFAVTDLKAVEEAVALMKVTMPYQQADRRTTAVRDVGFKELK